MQLAPTKLVSHWLSNPTALTQAEEASIASLLNRYPYFVPAQWMQLRAQIDANGTSETTRLQSILYQGNWLVQQQAITATQDTHAEPLSEDLNLPEHLATTNYFQSEGIAVSDELPAVAALADKDEVSEKALMIMMGFDEWLLFLKKKNEAKQSEEEDKAMLRSMWQREKLAAAMGEEDDNIPEAVFEMAISSIDKQDIMVSESLAEIHTKQGKFEKAIEIYRKLSLQNPEKKAYFAAKITQLNKEN